MLIRCDNLQELTEICYQLMTKGATFEASTTSLTITLTGGY